MKRDFNLIRLILLALEGDEEAGEKTKENYDQETIAFHAYLMKQADLVEGVIRLDGQGNPKDYRLSRMTWEGYDFLDAMRDAGLWSKAQKTILSNGASVTFGILKAWLVHEAKQKLGIETGE